MLSMAASASLSRNLVCQRDESVAERDPQELEAGLAASMTGSLLNARLSLWDTLIQAAMAGMSG